MKPHTDNTESSTAIALVGVAILTAEARTTELGGTLTLFVVALCKALLAWVQEHANYICWLEGFNGMARLSLQSAKQIGFNISGIPGTIPYSAVAVHQESILPLAEPGWAVSNVEVVMDGVWCHRGADAPDTMLPTILAEERNHVRTKQHVTSVFELHAPGIVIGAASVTRMHSSIVPPNHGSLNGTSNFA